MVVTVRILLSVLGLSFSTLALANDLSGFWKAEDQPAWIEIQADEESATGTVRRNDMNADAVGRYAQERMKALQTKHGVIGDVRGSGLIFSAEFVLDHAEKSPATRYADRIVNAMKDRGVILSKLGLHKNTLKIRPSMPFSKENADLLFDQLDQLLTELPVA